jgi:hypothetical protein
MLLIFVGAVANFPEPMDEDGARGSQACVEFAASPL